MKNLDVVRAFFSNKVAKSSNSNLRVEVGHDNTLRLRNYNTTLLQKNADGTIIYNNTRYSVSTSRIQSYIRRELGWRKYKEVNNINYDTFDLNKF